MQPERVAPLAVQSARQAAIAKIKLAFIANRRATSATEISGAVVCRQIDRFSSSDQSRRVRRTIGAPVMSAIPSGHYPTLFKPGRAARPDAYGRFALWLILLTYC